jgi:hypothetical protein
MLDSICGWMAKSVQRVQVQLFHERFTASSRQES